MSELLTLAKAKYFPDQEVLENCFRDLPRSKHPIYKVWCTFREFQLAEAVAPKDENVTFSFLGTPAIGGISDERNLRKKADKMIRELYQRCTKGDLELMPFAEYLRDPSTRRLRNKIIYSLRKEKS